MTEGKRGAASLRADGAQKLKPPHGGASATAEPGRGTARQAERFAALDLGTNNCRLLIAAPRGRRFRVIDAFSRIIRLGEGLSQTGRLHPAAMDRAIEALAICAEKIERRGVTRRRLIATQACRAAANGPEFLARVLDETGLEFEIITPEEEARLAVRGCAELIEAGAAACLVFDIGGGSTEISWVQQDGGAQRVIAWASLPIGVVNLSERWNGREIDADTYERIVASVTAELRKFEGAEALKPVFERGEAHLLGTSGTVTSIAGVHLRLDRYRRDLVDGLWLSLNEAREVSERLRRMDFEARAAEPCIGVERADLVVCGCAILEALLREWPADRIRVADRGLREGILADLADASRVRRRRRSRR